MTFQEQLNLYIEELSCSGRELAQNSGISETILSRYRKGERLPGADSDYLKKLATGIALTAEQKGKKKPFKNFNQFLKLYPKQKEELKRFIKENNVDFNNVQQISILCMHAESIYNITD